MTYTASEMRAKADTIEAWDRFELGDPVPPKLDYKAAAQMLRQAADAMEADDTLFAERIGP